MQILSHLYTNPYVICLFKSDSETMHFSQELIGDSEQLDGVYSEMFSSNAFDFVHLLGLFTFAVHNAVEMCRLEKQIVELKRKQELEKTNSIERRLN